MKQLVYILSASHSGSTLLAMLLGAHPKITTVGELKADHLGDLTKYRCSCGEMILSCPFWQKVREGMADHGLDFDLTHTETDFRQVKSRYANYLLKPLVRHSFQERFRDFALYFSNSWKNQFSITKKHNIALVDVISEISGTDIIVDSSKIGIRLKYLLRIPEFDIKIIRLIRDGRAVATTYTNPAKYADAERPDLRGGGVGGNRENEILPIARAAREWRRSNEEAEAVLNGLSRLRWTEVRYETLCRDTETTLNRLFSFIGVPPENTAGLFRKQKQHILGNGMRLDNSPEIRLDERWKTVLTPNDLQVFESIAGKMNHRYGYDYTSESSAYLLLL